MMNFNDLNKVIPGEKVYDDALSPAMKQIGKSLESVAKTSRFLLAPIEYIAARHDRWEKYLKKVSEKVKEENLTIGHPQIVIPTIEGLSLVYENTILSEFFINLLANSIDKTKEKFTHPAFPKIINELSHDEAVVLYYLKKQPFKLKQQSDLDNEKNSFVNRTIIEEEFPIDKLQFPEDIWLYMSHLNSLNLAGTWQVGKQESIYDEETKKQTGVYINSERRLNEFGRLFVNACVPDDFETL
jgi:hypothetical protein